MNCKESPCWLTKKGTVDEVAFCREFNEKMPLKCIKGRFYGLDGVVSDDVISHEISEMLTEYVSTSISRKVKSLTEALRLCCYSEPLIPDPTKIHLPNGTLRTDGMFIPEKRFCINRLNVRYDADNVHLSEPKRFLSFLNDLLEPEDIPTLQEYLGYCLIPSTKGQAMMFLIGNGEEGKSRIGKVMNAIWSDAMLEGKFHRIETDKFFRYNLVDKLVMVDDDMQLDALSSTGYIKSLATAEIPIDIEAKGKQSEQARVYTRILGFGNGSPKALYDRSEGFARRLLILTVKPKPPDRVNDPFLAERLIAEKDDIFMWMFRGLQRLIANRFKFTVSERTRKNVAEAVADSCNIIDFLQDKSYVTFDDSYSESTTSLYAAYADWCHSNSITPLKRDTFSSWIKANAEKYKLVFSTHIKNGQGREVRGYKGIRSRYVQFLQ